MCLIFPIVSTAQERPATVLTIYSSADFDTAAVLKGSPKLVPGTAVIQQRRAFELEEGESKINLPAIAATADFSTFSVRPLTPDSFKVLSQTFTEPAGDPEAFLRHAVGHEIIINRKPAPVGDHRTPETINARLVAFDTNQLVLQTNNRQLPIQIIPRNADIAEIKLMADSAPAARQAAWARVSCSKAGSQDALVSYQAFGMSWKADQEIVLGEDAGKAHLSSNITMVNRTGMSFDDAQVNLIGSRGKEGETDVYALPQPTSVAADSAQRVALVDGQDVACQIVLACTAADYGRTPPLAANYLMIENSSKNHLGRPLPAGRVRVIRQPAPDAIPMPAAEDLLPASRAGDVMLIRMGAAAATVSLKREVSERPDMEKGAVHQTITITLRNQSDQPQKVVLLEPAAGRGSQVIAKSIDFQTQSQSLLFRVDLPPADQKVISYTIRRPAQ